MFRVIIYLLILCNHLYAQGISKHFHSLEKNIEIGNPFVHIDYIYLINLDFRPEKLAKSLKQLETFGIFPYRFPAINGWNLSKGDLETIGVKLRNSSFMSLQSNIVSHKENKMLERVRLNSSHIGRTVFSDQISLGAIGCTLSHLSLLQDAYESGYENILIMEDDIKVVKDPRILDNYITLLNEKVGEGNWDVLYTDPHRNQKNFLAICFHKNSFSRPYFKNTIFSNPSKVDMYSNLYMNIDNNFMKIKCRYGAHSMVISRSGIKKILSFYEKYNMYIPYDVELAIIPEISLYCLTFDVVTTLNEISDTQKNMSSDF